MSSNAPLIAKWLHDHGLDQAPRPLATDEMRRAYHETGHAVGSRQLGMRVSSLSLGEVVSMVPLMEDGETMTDSGRRRFATVAYSGPLAETRYAKLAGYECRTLWLDGAPWCGDRKNIETCALGVAQRAKARRDGGPADHHVIGGGPNRAPDDSMRNLKRAELSMCARCEQQQNGLLPFCYPIR